MNIHPKNMAEQHEILDRTIGYFMDGKEKDIEIIPNIINELNQMMNNLKMRLLKVNVF